MRRNPVPAHGPSERMLFWQEVASLFCFAMSLLSLILLAYSFICWHTTPV